MTATSALLAGRRAAEARMTSRVTIYRRTGLTAQNETTGREVPTWETVATDVPFRLGSTRGAGASRTTGIEGSEVEVALRTGHLPYDRSVLDGDYLDVTDGENAGTAWVVVEGDWQDQATARRVPIVAVTRPEEWA